MFARHFHVEDAAGTSVLVTRSWARALTSGRKCVKAAAADGSTWLVYWIDPVVGYAIWRSQTSDVFDLFDEIVVHPCRRDIRTCRTFVGV